MTLATATSGTAKRAPGDARDESAGCDGDHDRERVDLDDVADDERLKYVALDLLHEDHDAEHDEGRHRAEVDERDETTRKRQSAPRRRPG